MKAFAKLVGTSLLVILSVGCAPRVLVQPSVDTTRYNRIAILPLESDNYFSTIGNQMADEVVVDLLKNAHDIDVIERSRIDALMREQDLGRAGYVSPESAVAIGRLLGVRALLTGSVSISIGDIRPTPLSAQRVATGVATVRLIDTETGRVIWGDRKQSEYSMFLRTGDTLSVFKTDQEMVQEVVKQLAIQIAQMFYPHYEYRY